MEIRKIKFPGKLFRKKVLVLNSSEEDYNYLVSKVDFDPVYFLSVDHEYGNSINEIFNLINYDSMTVSYIDSPSDMSFYIEFINLKKMKYKDFKKKSDCRSFLGQFLYEPNGSTDIYVIRVYGDL